MSPSRWNFTPSLPARLLAAALLATSLASATLAQSAPDDYYPTSSARAVRQPTDQGEDRRDGRGFQPPRREDAPPQDAQGGRGDNRREGRDGARDSALDRERRGSDPRMEMREKMRIRWQSMPPEQREKMKERMGDLRERMQERRERMNDRDRGERGPDMRGPDMRGPGMRGPGMNSPGDRRSPQRERFDADRRDDRRPMPHSMHKRATHNRDGGPRGGRPDVVRPHRNGPQHTGPMHTGQDRPGPSRIGPDHVGSGRGPRSGEDRNDDRRMRMERDERRESAPRFDPHQRGRGDERSMNRTRERGPKQDDNRHAAPRGGRDDRHPQRGDQFDHRDDRPDDRRPDHPRPERGAMNDSPQFDLPSDRNLPTDPA